MSLRIVQPQPVTDAVLIASNVPESSYAAWSSVTTYTIGQRVHLTSTHKVYESATNANTNNPPASSPTQWVEVGPTNRWALFDRSNSTQTAQSTSISLQLRPTSAFDSLALLNLTGVNSLRRRVIHPTLGTLQDETVNLASVPMAPGWWQWFFGQRTAPSAAVFTDLPGVTGSDLYLDLSGTTAMAVGVCAFGQAREIGMGVKLGARVGIRDYSRKETNDFGDTVLVQRAFSKRASFDIPIESTLVDGVIDFLASIRAVPCLFIGSGRYSSTVVYGFYKDFDVNIAYQTVSECSLEVEGLT